MRYSTGLALLLPALCACQNADASPPPTPGALEVDLIFPRNSTFSSLNPVPVVFAVQNPLLANYLIDLQIGWAVYPVSSPGNLNASGAQQHSIAIGNFNSSTSSPYLSVSFLYELVGIDGQWVFRWDLFARNWTDAGYDFLPTVAKTHELYFTTNRNSAPPDLLAGDCNSRESVVFEASSFHHNPQGSAFPYEAILSNNTPSASPCAVHINASQTSAVVAQITSTICGNPTYNLTQVNVSCAGYSNAHSGAPLGFEAVSGALTGSFLAAMLGAVLML